MEQKTCSWSQMGSRAPLVPATWAPGVRYGQSMCQPLHTGCLYTRIRPSVKIRLPNNPPLYVQGVFLVRTDLREAKGPGRQSSSGPCARECGSTSGYRQLETASPEQVERKTAQGEGKQCKDRYHGYLHQVTRRKWFWEGEQKQ